MSEKQRVSLSVERRIILVFVVSALAGIVLVGGALRYFLQRAALAQCRTNLESLAGVLAAQCDSEIADARQDLEFLAKTPAFQQLPNADQIDPKINGVPENVDVEKRRFLSLLLNKAERFSVLYVLRPNADIYVLEPFRTQPKLTKQNLSDRPYYQEAVRTKAPVVSDSFVGADGVLAVVILVPLLADNGDVHGYLGGAFHLPRLSLLVSKKRVTPFDAGFIVDRKGMLIAHTETGLLQVGVRERFTQHHPLLSLFLASTNRTVDAGQRSVLFDECRDPAEAKPHLTALVPLSSGWALGLMRDRAAVLAEARPVIWGITALAAFLLALIGGLGVAFAHGIGRRWDSAERALRASEADLRTTLTSIGDGVIATDTVRRITRLNDAAAVLTGWSPQDAVGRALDDVFKIVNEETRAPAADPVARVLASGRIEGLANHSVLIARDGTERAIADSAAPIRDPAGDIKGVVLVFRDVSEQRRAAEALRESELKFRELAESLPQLVWTCRGDGPCDYLSPQWVQYTGIPEADQLGFRWLERLHPDDRERTVAAWNEAVAANKPFDVEFRIRRHDGIYRWFKTRAVALRDNDDRIVKWFGTSTDVDDQKRAEERFRIAAVSLSDVIYEWDLADRLDWFGDVDGLMGYAPGEFPRSMAGWGATLHPEDRERVMAAVARHLKGEAPYNVEYRLMRKDGAWAWWTARGTALRDAAGNPVRWIGAITDVTKRKQAEEELRRHRDHLEQLVAERTAEVRAANAYNRVLIEASIDPFVTIGKDGKITDVNNATAAMTGRSRDELIGTDFADYFTEPARAKAGYEKAFREGVVHDFELEVCHSNGKTVPVLYNATVYQDAHGHVAGVFAAARDITELRRVERLLQNQAREHAIILDSIPALVFYKDRENRIIRVNQDFTDAMGLTRKQMEGKSCLELWPAQGEEYWKADQEVMASETAKRGIIEPLQTTGGIRWLRTDKVPFRDENGVVTGIIGFSVDITERKLAEDRILKLNEDLARRTSELEAVNHELEAFSYSVSHDLKAPLRSVDGFAKMLEEDYAARLDDEGRRLLKVVRDSARDMGQLVNDLLTFSRLSRKELTVSRLDLARMVEDARRQVEPAAAGRTIRWEIGDLPPANGDETTIREVLLNLFANAVKFTRPRQQAVIGFAGYAEAGEMVYTVTDNGVGFNMIYKDKLFSVFQRLHTSDEFEGTGIGLALVQRIIQRHGGRVWAEGEVDKGARFYFTLPREGKQRSVTSDRVTKEGEE